MAKSSSNVIIEITKYLCYDIQNLLKGHLQTCSIILLIITSYEDKVYVYLEKHSKKEVIIIVSYFEHLSLLKCSLP